MKKRIQNLRNKKLLLPSIFLLTVFVTFGLATVLLSNSQNQSVLVYGIEGTLNVEVDIALDPLVFKGQSVNTRLRITRIDSNFNTEFAVMMSWNLSGQLDPLDLSGSKIIYQENLIDELASNVISPIGNGTNVYAQLITFADWSLIDSDIFYVDITFTIATASVLTGSMDVCLWVTDNT